MITYQMYKLLHVASVLLFFMLASVVFFLPAKARPWAGPIGALAFLMLFFGMGVAARSGLMEAWPAWATGKLVAWVVVAAGAHVIARRAKHPARIGVPFLFGCAILALYFVIYRPGS